MMKSRKIWMGRWLLWVAALHTLFGLAFGAKVLPGMLERGLFNTVGSDPMAGVVVWFLLFGAAMAILGIALSELERGEHFHCAGKLGAGTLMMTVTGVVLMPASGFWLVFPPAIGLIMRNRR